MGAVTTSKEERARILALRIENVPIKEICSRTGRHKTTVMRILAAARRLPPSQVPIPKPRPGRRKKTTKEIDCLLKMEVVNNPFISANELKKMYPRELQNVAERTIRHRLQIDLGLTCRPTRICEGRRMRRRVENWRLPTTKRVQITAMDPSLQEIEEKVDDVECKAEEEFLYEEELSSPDSNAFGEGHSQSKKKQENDDTSFAQTYEKVKPMLKDLGVRSQVLHEKKLSVEEVRLKAEEARLNAFNKMASFFESAEDFLNSDSDMMRALSQGKGHGRRGPRSKGPQTVKED